MKEIDIEVFHLHKNIKIDIDVNDTINNVKRKIGDIIDKDTNKIRLYPKENGEIKTGVSFYGLCGDIGFSENYREYDEFIVLLML